MNYARALATLNHARTGKRLSRKKLENATWLHEVLVHDSGQPCVSLSLFDKHILTWYPNGDIAIENHDYWCYSTKDRLNKYMPQGFQVWQNKPYWYLKTPVAVLPYYNRMHLNEKGFDLAAPDQVHSVGAIDMKKRVHEYAKAYAVRLVDGRISRTPNCTDCTTSHEHELELRNRLHMLYHLNRSEFPSDVVVEAMKRAMHADRCYFHKGQRLSTDFLTNMLFMSWREVQFFWRKPQSKRALIDQVEQKMTTSLDISIPPGRPPPRKYITNFRMMVEDFLLEYVVGFERMLG